MTDPVEASPPPAPRPHRRLRRGLIAAAVLTVAYGAAGFLVAPRVLQRALQERGSVALRRPVRVSAVKVNPFVLSVTVLGLEVGDLDGSRLASWEALHVRLAPWKLLFGDLGVAEIRLTRPSLRVGLDAAGRLNVQDLTEGGAGAAAPASQPAPAAPEGRLGVALDRLEVVEARVVFGDATVSPPFETTLGPLTVLLRDFRSRGGAESSYSLEGTTESGETFAWSGTALSEPIRSTGSIAFKGVKLPKYGPYLRGEAPNLEVRTGTASMTTRYDLAWGAAGRRLAISGLRLDVADLALALRGQPDPAVVLGAIGVSGVDVDLLARSAAVAEVKVSGGTLTVRRGRDGNLELTELSRLTPSPPSRWTWRVGAVALEKLEVVVDDQGTPRPARLVLSDVALRIEQLAKESAAACPISTSLRQVAGGTLAVKGTIRPFAPAGDLAVDAAGLELAALAPWLEGVAPIRVTDGRLGLALRTAFDASGPATTWKVGGDLRVEGLTLVHATRGEELVRWRALEVLGIDAASATRRAAVATVRLVEPRLRAVIFEDGTTGFSAAPGPAGQATASPPGAAPPAGPGWRTSLGLLQVVGGRLVLVDRSVTPPVLFSLTDLDARIARLSSDPRIRSTVDVKAKVDGSAPLTVTGTLNPLQASAYTDLAIGSQGIDLTPLAPYAGKHLGYGLQKGKLDLDLKAKVEERALAAGTVVRLDQLTLGEATNSPDATKLPVRLALALLRDKDGLILLDVPIEGKLDDPEFKLGRVIWHTLTSLLVKVAASPFQALAALAGGDQADLSLVEYAPGEAALDEAARKRIDLLARSLAQRPALGLELEGSADPGIDGAALRRVGLERLLRRTKALAQRPPVTAEDGLPVASEERARWVAAASEANLPAPAPRPAGQPPALPPTPAAQEERLLAVIQVPPEALPALAAARAAAARDALLAAGVEPARLFQVEGGARATKEQGARTYFAVQTR